MRKVKVLSTVAALGLLTNAVASVAMAEEKMTFVLNWFPTADHSPYYFAREQGWYADAGLDVEIVSAKGSGASSQQVAIGQASMGVADLATAFIARGKGADLVAVMAVYANSPQGFYWRKSASGIDSPEDFPGHTIGNPPGDAARVMWPAFAQAVGIGPESVKFVNIAPQAKLPSLMSDRIDIMSDFYNGHDLKVRELGEDMGFAAWRDFGINPYGNSILVNAEYLRDHRDQVAKFVEVTQKAFGTCAEDHNPCIDALMKNVSGLDRETQMDQWLRVEELMSTEKTRSVALGYLDPDGLEDSYKLVKKYFSLEQPFTVTDAYTNEFLSEDIKAPTPD
ncbi:ABC transporter substrate-binding protein [Nitratireductor aquimarinus]|uniref:ABC transporter substrate-binding protein n=1 Tax=Nitratireductor TaxID=245876 RepID=UPI0019D34C53|nr:MULTISPECIES: ABC transporter substrate-binding protein [Nitratireductor]MBN7776292.1 ABC transporter substrate-binding protein [Nitratireductor pacificus]MBN7779159.1 ABC transporter substrate-binding protein [Nitratireductor pacificus]MBN7787966.1 ABC transporter substrate-binding protein [Nitratireductor aquimarinus]MBY6098013.1 ABC transporter substrate-binding protein [Nitratireductor aquimarinus]MCA1262022.1 ABC transporter substrate-binding protein [Nitratireductor aquimarinus]